MVYLLTTFGSLFFLENVVTINGSDGPGNSAKVTRNQRLKRWPTQRFGDKKVTWTRKKPTNCWEVPNSQYVERWKCPVNCQRFGSHWSITVPLQPSDGSVTHRTTRREQAGVGSERLERLPSWRVTGLMGWKLGYLKNLMFKQYAQTWTFQRVPNGF